MDKITKKIKYSGDTEYNIVVNLTNQYYDIGFYSSSQYSGDTVTNNEINTINGTAISRLNELKKYTQSSNLSEKYIISSNGSDGVIINDSTNDSIKYIINNIIYIDDLINGSTTFTFNTPIEYTDLDNNFLVKEDKFLNYTNIKRNNNLDIVRQSLNIVEKHIRLTDIRNVEELTLYGGRYYNIYKNS